MYEYRVVEVLNVVDGDTIDCVISVGFGVRLSFRFRLASIDTPEMYGRFATPEGMEAREFSRGWLSQVKDLHVRTFKSSDSTVGIGDGAFGRWLAEFVNAETGDSLAEALRDAGFEKA